MKKSYAAPACESIELIAEGGYAVSGVTAGVDAFERSSWDATEPSTENR